MRYSNFSCLTNTTAQVVEESWDAFAAKMSQPLVVADKASVPLFNGTYFGGDGTRGKNNAVETSMLILDFDNADRKTKQALTEPMTPDVIEMILSGWSYVLATSHSHTDEWPKFRVVLPIASPVSSGKWVAFVKGALARLGLADVMNCLDLQVMNNAQAYYWPSHAPGRPFVYQCGQGDVLDPESLGIDAVATAESTGPKEADTLFTPEQIRAYYDAVVPVEHLNLDKPLVNGEWVGSCPIHGGVKPNFRVNASSGLWHCFSECATTEGAVSGGDIYEFHKVYKKVDFSTAKKEVEAITGMPGADTPDEVMDAVSQPDVPYDELVDKISKLPDLKTRNACIKQLVTTQQLDPEMIREHVNEKRRERKVIDFPKSNAELAAETKALEDIEYKMANRIPNAFGLCLREDQYDISSETGVCRVKWVGKDGNRRLEVQSATPIASRPIWPAKIAKDLASDTTYVLVCWEDSKGKRREKWLKHADLNERSIMSKLDDAPVTAGRWYSLTDYLGDATGAVVEDAHIITTTLGWIGKKDERRFILPNDPACEYVGPEVEVRGTLEGWTKGLDCINKLGKVGFTAMSLVGLSAAAPLVRLISKRNPIMGVACETSTGKGTAVNLALSIWGDVASMTVAAGSTVKGAQDLAVLRPDYPVFLDEVQQMVRYDPKQVEQLMYFLGNGQRRTTSSKNQTVWGGERRYGVGLYAAEHSVVDALQKGAQTRVVEFTQAPLPTSQAATEIQRVYRDNCGVVGSIIVGLINEDVAGWTEEVTNYVDKLYEDYPGFRGDDPYTVAFTAVGLKLLQEATGVAIDIDSVAGWLTSYIRDDRKTSKDNYDVAWMQLLDTILSRDWSVGGNIDTLSELGGPVAFRRTQAIDENCPLEIVATSKTVTDVLKGMAITERMASKQWALRGWTKKQSTNLKHVRRAEGKDGNGARVWRVTKDGLAAAGLNEDFTPLEAT